MANQTTNEPRALSAALAAPEFVTRGAGMAAHVANRHVERWAPETSTGTNRVRSLRSLGFVDRLVAPWIETAQRSASLRLFSQYQTSGMPERTRGGGDVSWVFPRPWYQDELDWMAAARQSAAQQAMMSSASPTMLTTRGTYVAPVQAQRAAQQQLAMPAALYEYVAPSLSLHAPQSASGSDRPSAMLSGGTFAPHVTNDAYSPLVPLAAVQAAQLVSRIAPLVAARAASPTLRSVLGSIVERATLASMQSDPIATRLSQSAPEMVTPPAPRADWNAPIASETEMIGSSSTMSTMLAGNAAAIAQAQVEQLRIAEQASAHRAQIVELQRVSRAAAITASSPIAQATSPSVVADAQTREAEIRTRIAESTAERQAQQASATAADRAAAQVANQQRTEAQVAQVTAQRTAARSLHETARAEAAAHVRAAIQQQAAAAAQAPTAQIPSAPAAVPQQPRVPAEVLAAIAALPPELARAITANPSASPLAMIAELGESLRTTELLARNAAAGRSIEVSRGPRLVMPVGLGGLVATIDRAAPSPAIAAAMAPLPTAAQQQAAMGPQMLARTARMPALPWVASARPAALAQQAPAQNAFSATTAAQPQTLHHVAWADRWLARFAGATPQSLDMLAATGGGSRSMRMQALADAAPGTVFVAPQFDIDDAPATRVHDSGRVSTAGVLSQRVPQQTLVAPMDQGGPVRIDNTPLAPHAAERFDDNQATPDDVFLQIAAAASSRRRAAAAPPAQQAAQQAAAAAEAARQDSLVHPTFVDSLAHSVPMAPGAGLSASLSASPFAPALQHVLPLAHSRSFDVRALFGGEIAATYLAGLFAPATQEVASSGAAPAWARGFELAAAPTLGGELATRSVPELDMAYVVPEQDRGGDAATSQTSLEGLPPEIAAQVQAQQAQQIEQQQQLFVQQQQLTTLRSALLSWTVDDRGAISPAVAQQLGLQQSIATTATEAQGAIAGMPAVSGLPMTYAMFGGPEAAGAQLAMPMLGDVGGEPQLTWGAPGMVGNRAHAWSVAQERSTTDLALDFVSPELVLAARVYGFGPAEAIQAARLAIAGPTQLTAMAGAVDRTFVAAMAAEVERQRATISTAYPDATGGVRVVPRAQPGMPQVSPEAAFEAAVMPAGSPVGSPLAGSAPAMTYTGGFTPSTTSFGVERRSPRGAFLWPAAAVAALGLDAPSPDGNLGMTVAALELLAAQAVAEIGTYAANVGGFGPQATGQLGDSDATTGSPVGPFVGASAAAARSATTSAVAQPGAEASESAVLDTVTALVPSSRRARFDALYVALGQSVQSREWSPAARAARALALVGRGDVDTANLSAHERAATVWDVLPVVYALGERGPDGVTPATSRTGLPSAGPAMSGGRAPGMPVTAGSAGPGSAAARAPGQSYVALSGQADVQVDGRPGLGSLSSRAGEALGSYVTASAASDAALRASSSSRGTSPDNLGAIHRAPSAAPELVRTGGRSSARAGGGETEIPAWFEAAARKMFGEGQTQSMGSDISLSELTLIQSAPPSQIAASSRGASAPTPAPSSNPVSAGSGPDLDLEQIAGEVYRHIVDLMDHARTRNGESF